MAASELMNVPRRDLGPKPMERLWGRSNTDRFGLGLGLGTHGSRLGGHQHTVPVVPRGVSSRASRGDGDVFVRPSESLGGDALGM